MRMLDFDRKQSVRYLQLYLTAGEAMELRSQLGMLLEDPDALSHFHIQGDDGSRDLSCSILTEAKLQVGEFTALEREVIAER